MTTSNPAQAYTQGTGTSAINNLMHYDVRQPASTDVNYKVGTTWVDTANNNVFTLTSFSSLGGSMSANWALLGGGNADVNTLSGDTGTAVPSGGNIQLIGGAGIVTTGAGAAITIALEGGSVGIDSFTPDAGTSPVVPTAGGLVTMAGTANQITTTGGTNSLTFSVPATFIAPGTVTSTGLLTGSASATINTGATALNLGTDNAAGTINIGLGATGRSINIGTSAANNALVIGSTSGTSGTTFNAGSGGFGMVATNGPLTAATGTGAINISPDNTNTTINIGTGGGVKTSTFGSSNTTSTTTVQSGTGGLGIASNNGVMVLTSGTGIMNISGDSTNTTVLVGTGAGVKATTIGSSNTTSTTNIQSGTAGIGIASNNGVMALTSGTGVMNISADAAATAVNIATGAAAKTVIIGSTNSTSATTINSGSGNLTLVGNVTKSTSPCFMAYLAATVNNKTGNGAVYQLGTDALTEIYDFGNNFNTNGTFTAPVAGVYDFRAVVQISNITAATTFAIAIVTASRTYSSQLQIPATPGASESILLSALGQMNAGDAAVVNIVATGEAGDICSVVGSGTLFTYFCGCLVA
tara:strand:- start:2340 stop:4088 length:1749 start_codon:yes stop_codon:yes gene_type:complete